MANTRRTAARRATALFTIWTALEPGLPRAASVGAQARGASVAPLSVGPLPSGLGAAGADPLSGLSAQAPPDLLALESRPPLPQESGVAPAQVPAPAPAPEVSAQAVAEAAALERDARRQPGAARPSPGGRTQPAQERPAELVLGADSEHQPDAVRQANAASAGALTAARPGPGLDAAWLSAREGFELSRPASLEVEVAAIPVVEAASGLARPEALGRAPRRPRAIEVLYGPQGPPGPGGDLKPQAQDPRFWAVTWGMLKWLLVPSLGGVAFHEYGHFLAARLLGLRVESVSLITHPEYGLGAGRTVLVADPKARPLALILSTLAGPLFSVLYNLVLGTLSGGAVWSLMKPPMADHAVTLFLMLAILANLVWSIVKDWEGATMDRLALRHFWDLWSQRNRQDAEILSSAPAGTGINFMMGARTYGVYLLGSDSGFATVAYQEEGRWVVERLPRRRMYYVDKEGSISPSQAEEFKAQTGFSLDSFR